MFSKDALKISENNALENNVEITFILQDIKNIHSTDKWHVKETFDIIVSNPPYVTVSEKGLMEKNVLDYEPELALFVDDNNPLIFYKVIVEFAKKHLSKNGMLYFEINEMFGKEVKEILLLNGFKKVNIVKDINSRNRFVKGQL